MRDIWSISCSARWKQDLNCAAVTRNYGKNDAVRHSRLLLRGNVSIFEQIKFSNELLCVLLRLVECVTGKVRQLMFTLNVITDLILANNFAYQLYVFTLRQKSFIVIRWFDSQEIQDEWFTSVTIWLPSFQKEFGRSQPFYRHLLCPRSAWLALKDT